MELAMRPGHYVACEPCLETPSQGCLRDPVDCPLTAAHTEWAVRLTRAASGRAG